MFVTGTLSKPQRGLKFGIWQPLLQPETNRNIIHILKIERIINYKLVQTIAQTQV